MNSNRPRSRAFVGSSPVSAIPWMMGAATVSWSQSAFSFATPDRQPLDPVVVGRERDGVRALPKRALARRDDVVCVQKVVHLPAAVKPASRNRGT
jgi:hypothetical protein